MIKKIVVDGNDGTGKTFRVNLLRKMFPNIKIEDRGIFSDKTLDDMLFDYNKASSVIRRKNFVNAIDEQKDTLFIICDASVETCQKRISERGDSLEEEYHNKKDLIKYRGRFMLLAELCSELPNVMFIDTDEDLV
jgi:thymidylate kinase